MAIDSQDLQETATSTAEQARARHAAKAAQALSEARLNATVAITVAVLAVTALTGRWPLVCVALFPTFFGVLRGVAGLAALPIHPQALIGFQPRPRADLPLPEI